MFDPSFSARRRVDFGGKAQVEDKSRLLDRARQERQQRQHVQLQHNAAVSIQRWYRSHTLRKLSRSTLRLTFDAEWKAYTAFLSGQAGAAAVDRQQSMARMVRLLWLLYDATVDGLRLVSLAAAVVKSNDAPVSSTQSFLHTRAGDWQPPWPRQASHLCTLCLSRLIAETREASPAPFSSSPPVAATAGDKRVCALLVAALSLLLDHGKWNAQKLDAAAFRSSAVQYEQLLDSLASSPAFFPALRLLLCRLCSDDTTPASPFAVALLTALTHALEVSSQRDASDAFAARFVAELLTVPCIAAYLRLPALLPLFIARGHHLTSHLLAATRRLVQSHTPLSGSLPPSSSSIPSSAFLLGNAVQLAATVEVKRAQLPFLLDYLSVSTALLHSLPPHLLHDDDEKTPAWSYNADAKRPSPLPLPACTVPSPPVTSAATHSRLRAAVIRQYTPLFTSSFFIGLLHRAFLDRPTADVEALLSSYSLSTASAECNERLQVVLAAFIHTTPSYLPLVCRLLTLAVSRSPFARSALSSLTFNSPILLALWRTLEVSIGSKLTALHQPLPATAEELKAASASSSSSLLALFSSTTSKPTKPAPTDSLRAPRLRWYAAIMGRQDGNAAVEGAELQSIFLLFLHCYLPLLFIVEDSELLSTHPPFDSLLTLQALAHILKLLVFRLTWHSGALPPHATPLSEHLHVCRLILVELYQRDIRCEWMTGGAPPPTDEGEEQRIERGGRAWLIDADDGGAEWTAAWNHFMAHSDGGPLDLYDDEGEGGEPPTHQRVLRVLRPLPFITPFRDRIVLFRRQLAHYRAMHAGQSLGEVRVRRAQVISDGLAAINLPGSIRVKFVDETGEDEQGMDVGGPFKELLELLTKEVFRLDYGLFTSTAAHTYYPNPLAVELVPGALQTLHSVGRLIGRCINEGILLEVALASVVLQKMVGQGRVLGDLRELDESLYNGLMQVKRYAGDVEDLCLTFSVDEEVAGVKRTVELEEGGANKPVTNLNRTRFIYQAAEYHLNVKLRPVMAPFIEGIASVIPLASLRLFNLSEVRLLLSGSHQPLDVSDWQHFTRYENCDAGSRHVRWFWQCVAELSPAQQKALLQFVTSVSRSPYLGFGALNPPFTVRLVSAEAGEEESGVVTTTLMGWLGKKGKTGALPSASTCFNLLKLPKYATAAIMKDKLTLAIQAKGFHLV